jgi:phosphoglycolate phosphatase
MRHMADVVIFDLDGTLIDSAPEIHGAVNAVLAHYNLGSLTADQVRGFVGNGAQVLIAKCLAAVDAPDFAPLRKVIYDDFITLYERSFTLTRLYPGVTEMLHTLSHRGHKLGICTNKPTGPTRAVLQHFGLQFPVIIGGDALPQRKPDPAPLHRAHTMLGGGPVIFVGDSEVDATTAQAAALPFALFTGGYRTTPVADLPHTIAFDDHATFADMIARPAPK